LTDVSLPMALVDVYRTSTSTNTLILLQSAARDPRDVYMSLEILSTAVTHFMLAWAALSTTITFYSAKIAYFCTCIVTRGSSFA